MAKVARVVKAVNSRANTSLVTTSTKCFRGAARFRAITCLVWFIFFIFSSQGSYGENSTALYEEISDEELLSLEDINELDEEWDEEYDIFEGKGGSFDFDKRDYLERYNRAVFSMNEVTDEIVWNLWVRLYLKMPKFFQRRMEDFLANAAEPVSAVNFMLQRKPNDSLRALVRFGINSIAGVGGTLDVAARLGIPYKRTDFYETMMHYYPHRAQYIVIPILGPSNVSMLLGLVVDMFLDPLFYVSWYYDKRPYYTGLFVLNVIKVRASLHDVFKSIEETSFDEYTDIRNMLLQSSYSAVRKAEEEGEYGDLSQ